MESIKELLKRASGVLKESGNSETPILDAELLLIYVLNKAGSDFDRLKLMTQSDYLVDSLTAAEYLDLIHERSKGKPVQYIIQNQEFMGLMLHISEGVLIPRADTEIIVERVLELLKAVGGPNIIDMCTGSGAIAVSLASLISNAKVWAVDISDAAVECCKINVVRFGLEDRVAVSKGDLFEGIACEKLTGQIDVIVSNPPYIESSEVLELGVNVRDYEPHLALDGGKDGLVYYRRIVQDAAPLLKDGGVLAFEIGYNQGEKVKNIMEERGYYADVRIEKDLSGLDRCIWGYRKH